MNRAVPPWLFAVSTPYDFLKQRFHSNAQAMVVMALSFETCDTTAVNAIVLVCCCCCCYVDLDNLMGVAAARSDMTRLNCFVSLGCWVEKISDGRVRCFGAVGSDDVIKERRIATDVICFSSLCSIIVRYSFLVSFTEITILKRCFFILRRALNWPFSTDPA